MLNNNRHAPSFFKKTYFYFWLEHSKNVLCLKCNPSVKQRHKRRRKKRSKRIRMTKQWSKRIRTMIKKWSKRIHIPAPWAVTVLSCSAVPPRGWRCCRWAQHAATQLPADLSSSLLAVSLSLKRCQVSHT